MEWCAWRSTEEAAIVRDAALFQGEITRESNAVHEGVPGKVLFLILEVWITSVDDTEGGTSLWELRLFTSEVARERDLSIRQALHIHRGRGASHGVEGVTNEGATFSGSKSARSGVTAIFDKPTKALTIRVAQTYAEREGVIQEILRHGG
jgi:hypothetical protein